MSTWPELDKAKQIHAVYEKKLQEFLEACGEDDSEFLTTPTQIRLDAELTCLSYDLREAFDAVQAEADRRTADMAARLVAETERELGDAS